MKKMMLALAVAAAALGSTFAAAQSAPATKSEFLVCDYDPRAMVLNCWDSTKTVKYQGVPFSKAFDEGWKLIQAYTSNGAHYWILERPPVGASAD